jgi:CRP-like cAMP-binding protein
MILIEDLEKWKFARDLGQPWLGRLAGLARLKEFPEGEVLFHEGEASPSFYVVLSGRVTLEIEHQNDEIIDIDTAGPGDMLGWSVVFGQPRMTATARTASRCQLAVFDSGRIVDLCDHDPSFGVAFLRQIGQVVSDRLNSTRRCLAFARALGHVSPFALTHEDSH